MRVVLKLIEMLLQEGQSNAVECRTYSHIGGYKGLKRFEAFISDVEKAVNTKILGDDRNPAQWRFPLSADKKSMGQLKSNNGVCKMLIAKVDVLVELCVVEDNRRATWIEAANYFRLAMVIAN
jgi:hypothetical protein